MLQHSANNLTLEACVENLDHALRAEELGATQIELCDRLDLDGTSPPITLVRSVVSQCSIPIKIIVNPKPYDYQYDADELAKICTYIRQLSESEVAGIVFGPTLGNGMPDLHALDVVREVTVLPITYHKAIDAAPDTIEAVNTLIGHGSVDYILSSGGAATALQGIHRLIEIQKILSTSTGPQLIAAGSITHQNLPTLHARLGLAHYHGKLIVGNLQ